MVERDMSDGCDACLSRVGRAAFRLKRSTFSLPEDSPRVFESSSGRGDQGAFETACTARAVRRSCSLAVPLTTLSLLTFSQCSLT
jgi:hypothetical protein